MNTRMLQTIVIVSVCYVAAQIFADVASLRIIVLFGLAVDAGTLVYPFTFTLRDMVHKVAGVAIARTLIIVAAILNLVMAGLFWVAAQLPADPQGGEQSDLFPLVLAPVIRIVIASIIAEIVSELIDTEMYKLWVKRFGKQKQWGRVLLSNAISVPIDSVIFVLIAFAGVLPPAVVLQIFLVNVLMKGAVTIISIPGIYLVKDQNIKADA